MLLVVIWRWPIYVLAWLVFYANFTFASSDSESKQAITGVVRQELDIESPLRTPSAIVRPDGQFILDRASRSRNARPTATSAIVRPDGQFILDRMGRSRSARPTTTIRKHGDYDIARKINPFVEVSAAGEIKAPIMPPQKNLESIVTKRPNLLLLLPDAWRWDWAGFDEPELRVPTMKALAEKGTRFTRAYAPSSKCRPSRVCLAAGKEYDEIINGIQGSDFPRNTVTWFQALQKHGGYHTMTVGKDDLTKTHGPGMRNSGGFRARQLGFSDWHRTEGKITTFDYKKPIEPYGMFLERAKLNNSNQSAYNAARTCYRKACCRKMNTHGLSDCAGADPLEGSLHPDQYVTDWAIRLIKRAPEAKPWAMQVNFPGPHKPFILTKRMNQSMSGRSFPAAVDSVGSSGFSLAEVDSEISAHSNLRRQYAAEIENLDQLMGQILQSLRQIGQDRNTLVVVSSDHGEELGDHANFGKSRPWEGATHVPLVVSGPGVSHGRVVDVPVTTLDVSGTFLDRAQVQPAKGMTARSLWPMLSAKRPSELAAALENYRSHVTTGLNNFRVVVQHVDKSTTIKLVCCKGDCPNRPNGIPARRDGESMMVLLFNLTANDKDMSEILLSSPKEAVALMEKLPAPYNQQCLQAYAMRGIARSKRARYGVASAG